MNAEMNRQEKWLNIQSWSKETLPKLLAVIYEYVWLVLESKNCPLSLLVIWMRLRAPTWTRALRSSVKHYFKAHQRKHSDYSDVFATLRHHSVSVTTSKWQLQVPLARTLGCHRNRKKKIPLCRNERQPIHQTELNILNVLHEDNLSNIQKRSAFICMLFPIYRHFFYVSCTCGGGKISWTPVQS